VRLSCKRSDSANDKAWYNRLCTFKNIGFALAIASYNDINIRIKADDGILFVRLKVGDGESLHSNLIVKNTILLNILDQIYFII
jgi:hypothetical protein